ncbi:SET domain-containing protein [Cladorrhinum samala]|uniref:SET domain-containing protein n=1 Tax=Cladorrhinum samala TaxID=585594 RepID=A0AAV9HLX6_9PEZI|nr:SET domain-containing protein [Cladorrhinum samala]
MLSPDDRARLRRALKEMVLSQLVDLLSDHPSDELADSTISFEAFLQTRGSNHPNAAVDASPKKARKQMVSGDGPQPTPDPNPPAGPLMGPTSNALAARPRAVLRPASTNICPIVDDDDGNHSAGADGTKRQIQLKARSFPKRIKLHSEVPAPKEATVAKFLLGIWEHIHSGTRIESQKLVIELQQSGTSASLLLPSADSSSRASSSLDESSSESCFKKHNLLCRRITLLSRTCRALEVMIQARWTESFNAYVSHLASTRPDLSPTKARQAALASACRDFGWSEKELRNKMAIWRGYKEIKDAGGWVMLVFAGMGLYRMCKYRVGFDDEMNGLKKVLGPAKERVELAADTLQPGWRAVLSVIGIEGEGSTMRYAGHAHDWVVAARDGGEVVPLKMTYREGWLGDFRHVNECVLSREAWGGRDPRRVASEEGFICDECKRVQSDSAKDNECYCFPRLFGCGERPPAPVQIFRTANGRNNGVQALVPFERGLGIGEFVGLVTKGMDGVDVMDAVAGTTRYQIWQGIHGNFTRFINHSCKPNSQFQRFVWRGLQRIILVSKGLDAGMEITVDYSPGYWRGLKKKCLCGEKCCRYKLEEGQG